MNRDERICRDLMDMQQHFNKMIEAYERLPALNNIVRKTILEDALSVVSVSMTGITHEIADLYGLVPMQQWPDDEPTLIEVEAIVNNEGKNESVIERQQRVIKEIKDKKIKSEEE